MFVKDHCEICTKAAISCFCLLQPTVLVTLAAATVHKMQQVYIGTYVKRIEHTIVCLGTIYNLDSLAALIALIGVP